MGEQRVSIANNSNIQQGFVRNLLRDIQALEYMLEHDWFERDKVCIGAEQEMFLIDRKTLKPAPMAMEALEHLQEHPWVETELARFNLEINLDPRTFTGACLSELEAETREKLNIIRGKVLELGGDVVLTGILPTLRKFDLELHNLTPKKRYRALIDAINQQLIGAAYELRLTGIDELLVKHDSPLLEACNTSFQVHLQVSPDNFACMYNIAQALTAPVMAIAANSPLVFGKRLWHESRIALFQQALDIRTTHDHMRERSPRVNFGNGWLDASIMEIYKEDIARFRVLLSADVQEDSIEQIHKGKAPRLRALQVHNSTVYRWNRPCYGISTNGMPHLRIENRVLPAGPTVVDEVANAAFWLGAVVGMRKHCEDIQTKMNWEDARDNFLKAARFGIDSKFTWFDEQKVSACDLILQELLPIAREGLADQNVKQEDIDRYLGIIEARARGHANGALWQLKSFNRLKKQTTRDEALSVITGSLIRNQETEMPVHTWNKAELEDLPEYRPSKLKVEEFMETDLFTVQKDDLLELVAELMDWRRIRYMPVEDIKGNLCGLITSRLLLRYYTHRTKLNGREAMTVKDIMIAKPKTVEPSATIMEAMKLMRDNRIGCLPVAKNGELIGMITEMDFLRITGRLMERIERQE